MRNYILIIFLFLSLNTFSQKLDTCFTKNEIINIAHGIKQLKYRDSINTLIIQNQDTLINDYKLLIQQDSLIIVGKNEIISKYKDNENNYKKIIEKQSKNNKLKNLLHVGYGIIPGIIIGIILMK